MFSPGDRELERGWPGRIEGDSVVQLAAQTLQSFFTGGGEAREHAVYPLADVVLRAPVLHPPSIRDFDSAGAFHFTNPVAIHGPGDEVAYPEGTTELDFELELAAVIGAEGRVGGFTIMNDWTARDVERTEMERCAAPAKSTDFATSLGPIVVTPDELESMPWTVVAQVNGEEWARVTIDRLEWESLVELARLNTRLLAGDVIGLGPLAVGEGRALQPTDIVRLEVDGIGVLQNRVAPRES